MRRGFLLLALLAGACERPASQRCVSLARAFRPPELLERAQTWQRAHGLDPARCTQRPWSVRVDHPLPRAAWTAGFQPGSWHAELPGGALAFAAPENFSLHDGPTALARANVSAELGPRSFRVEPDGIHLRLNEGEAPSDGLLLSAHLEQGGATGDGTFQVTWGEEYGAGIPLWSHSTEELACELPPESELSFLLRFASVSGGEVHLRVELDCESVLDARAASAELGGDGRWFRVRLPGSARDSARLRFGLEAPPGRAVLFYPWLGPTLDRASSEPRPDIVLLIADTLRADGLASLGGAPDWMPRLNAFAEGAVRFQDAHATAAWTLPSIAALLTGYAPGQHTANTSDNRLPDELTTLAERLSASGYRTAAITDGAFFAPNFGLDQGFESFQMHAPERWDLDWTVARARAALAQRDGRPLFLVVHTYRAHNPYRVGAEEDVLAWQELLASGCVLIKSKGVIPREEWRARLAACREGYSALYREGLRDLDRGLGAILAAVEERGANTFVVFTADHGEALGENEDMFHDGKLWESKLCIPLLVRGPGLAPRTVPELVTSLDLAPTVAEWAGLAKDPRWSGDSLLAVERERAAGALLLKRETEIALLRNKQKLVFSDLAALERGEPARAYDLRTDPHEEHSRVGESWVTELARGEREFLRTLLTPLAHGAAARLSGSERTELGQLGYGGGSEEGEGD